jgi:glycosyltransferase involved in cell wall biosynthesis
VVIPTFNGEKYIAQAIESVLWQEGVSPDDIEILIVDDGSTDSTVEIAKRYSCRIIEIGKNLGVANARNEGIRQAKGEFISFLDQDDVYLPYKIRLSLEVFRNHSEADFIYSDVIIYDEVLGLTWNRTYPKGDKKNLLKDLFLSPLGVPSCWMIKKDAFDKIGYFDGSFFGSDDWDMSFRVVRSLKYMYIPIPTVIYRIHEGNTFRFRDKIRKAWEDVFIKAIREISPDELFASDPIRGYEKLKRRIEDEFWQEYYFVPMEFLKELEKKIIQLKEEK